MPPWKADDSVPVLQMRQHMQNQRVREPRLGSRDDLAAHLLLPRLCSSYQRFLFIRKKLNFLMNTLSALKNVINFLNYLFYNILSLTHFSYKLKLFLLASPGGIYLVTFTH